MEICEGGDIFDKILEIGNFSEWESKIILVQVVRCLSYLHSNLIIHRDLKPENILFQQKNKLSSIYLIDFGLSCKN
jgi:calcium-dependent protein kinase